MMASDDKILARYRVLSTASEIDTLARSMAYEQTVEVPAALIRDAGVRSRVVGTVRSIEAEVSRQDSFCVEIGYTAELASEQLGQLFNLLYGNISMYPGVRLLEIDLPESVTGNFHGPRFGVQGLRGLLGIYDRPLLATAIKPRGMPIEALARLAGEFARGGGDLVKDDQNLVDADWDTFRRRIDACAVAVEQANQQTGRQCLYLPHLAGADAELDQRARYIRERGLPGALVCPLVMGLDRSRTLLDRYGLLGMAHPALSGAYTHGEEHGIAHAVLLGTLFRLSGADISVFPATGGRFGPPASACRAVAKALVEPLGNLRSAMPAPAGGMSFKLIPDLIETYGLDTVLLVGGALHGHSEDLCASTQKFAEAIRVRCGERCRPPLAVASSCELPVAPGAIRSRLAVLDGFHWQGREDRPYKSSHELDFAGVRRVELIGKSGEACQFDLRYFELAPGGHTSLERHAHTHVLIGARGHGWVQMDGEQQPLEPHDVAYIAPQRVHQLRNESAQPFGFYCLVDRQRDQPVAPGAVGEA